MAVIVPIVSPYDTSQGLTEDPFSGPSGAHWFGTDNLGRDVFTRVFAAARLDITLAVVGVSVPLITGMMVGAIIGTSRWKWVSATWDTIIQATNAFPGLVILIAIAAVVGQGVKGIMIGLFLVAWARYAQVSKARARAIRRSDFMLATECLGYSRWRVLTRHVVPSVYRVCLAYALSDFVVVVLAIAGLSFLGAGVLPPTPEWGAMMAEGRVSLLFAWWIVMFPAAALAVTAVAVALVAQESVGTSG